MAEKHTGKPLVETIGERVVVLCPQRHVITSMKLNEWSGSPMEARTADPNYKVECGGAIAALHR